MYNENTEIRVETSLLTRAGMSASLKLVGAAWEGFATSHEGVARCLRFLRRNRLVQFNVGELERVAGLKRRGLHKAFITHLGCSPGVLLRLVRLVRACDMLANSSRTVDEIARRCGYRSGNSLWVVFARDLGVSPVHFRAQRRAKTVGNVRLSKVNRTRGIRATLLRKGSPAAAFAASRCARDGRSPGNRRLTPVRVNTKLVKR